MIFLAIFFVLSHSPTGDSVVQYTGMDQATIIRLETERGNTVTFITENDYTQWITANKSVDSVPSSPNQEAKDIIQNPKSTDSEKINAIIDFLNLKS